MYKRTYTGGVFSAWMEMKFTDTQVTQTAINSSDYTNWRTIIWGSSNSATEGFTPASVTDSVFSDPNLTYQPSSGTLRANTFKGNLSGNASSASNVAWGNVSGKPSTFPPSSHTHSYLPISGGNLTGSLTFCNSTWNTVGDDVAIGDIDLAGTLGVVGKNGTTTIRLFPYQTDASLRSANLPAGAAWICTGNNTSTITGTLSGTFYGPLTGNASSASSVPWSGVTGKPSTYPSEDNLVISKTAPGKTCLWAKID